MAICHFQASIVNYSDNWLLVSKTAPTEVSWPWSQIILGPKEEEIRTALFQAIS
jgi:hypothetical protein